MWGGCKRGRLALRILSEARGGCLIRWPFFLRSQASSTVAVVCSINVLECCGKSRLLDRRLSLSWKECKLCDWLEI